MTKNLAFFNDCKPITFKKQNTSATSLIILIVMASCLFFGMFGIHGVLTLFKWIFPIQFGFILFGVLSLIAILSGLIENRHIHDGKLECKIRLWIKVLFIIGMIIPLSVYSIAFLFPRMQFGDSKPMLFLINQNGSNGIPNYAVTWRTENPTIDHMQWGNDTFSEILSDPSNTHSHVFIMKDLEPNSQYWYKIHGKNTTFTTAKNDGRIHIALGGDMHFGMGNNINQAKLMEYINNSLNPYDGIFVLGDFVSAGFYDKLWKKGISIMSNYCDSIPIRPLIGNHDAIFNGITLYEQYFYPKELPSESNSPFYYYLKFGNIHIICLQLEWGLETYSETQHTWLKNTLESIPENEWKIVLSHSTFFSSGGSSIGVWNYNIIENIRKITPIFEENGVDMVINGHNHIMEVSNHSNIMYNTIGTFGNKEMDRIIMNYDENSIFLQKNVIGYIELTIESNTCNVIFHGSNNEELYSYSLNMM